MGKVIDMLEKMLFTVKSIKIYVKVKRFLCARGKNANAKDCEKIAIVKKIKR